MRGGVGVSEDERVQEILDWIAVEKKKPYPDKSALIQAVEDIRQIKQDWRVTSHGEGMFNQKKYFLE